MAQLKDTVVSGNLRVTDTINAHDMKLDGGTNNGITIKYDSSVSNYSGINYQVGNVIQSQFGWYRPSSGTGAYYYFGALLGDTRAYHDQFYSKKYTVASSSSTSYNTAITGSFTTNRTITIPDSSGTMSVSKLVFTSTGATSGLIDVPIGARYLVIEVFIAATSVKSFHKVAIDTSCTSTSLIQTTTKGQYGLQLTIQPIQFTLTNATSITGGTRYTLTMNVGSVMSISAGTTPSAASASPQITKVYAQA